MKPWSKSQVWTSSSGHRDFDIKDEGQCVELAEKNSAGHIRRSH
jgi:hypothetical protein